MMKEDTLWRGDYRELLSLSLLYQTEEIPLWLVRFSDEHSDKRLRGMSTINIFKVFADWI